MSHDFIVNAIGYVSTACICINQVPQIIQIVRSRNVAGLSLATNVIYTAGNAAGLVYGIAIDSMPVAATSIVTLVTSITVAALIIASRTRATHA